MSDGIVLLSGGIDSAVTLGIAAEKSGRVLAVTFDYGQRSREQELACSKILTKQFDAERIVVKLDFGQWGGSALTDDIDVPTEETEGIPITYVPARNIVFLTVAASIAEAEEYDSIWYGANVVDYSGYPDCRREFIEALQKALRLGMKDGIEIKAPLLNKTKREIIKMADKMGINKDDTWSCYFGGPEPCGVCPSCRVRAMMGSA